MSYKYLTNTLQIPYKYPTNTLQIPYKYLQIPLAPKVWRNTYFPIPYKYPTSTISAKDIEKYLSPYTFGAKCIQKYILPDTLQIPYKYSTNTL